MEAGAFYQLLHTLDSLSVLTISQLSEDCSDECGPNEKHQSCLKCKYKASLAIMLCPSKLHFVAVCNL